MTFGGHIVYLCRGTQINYMPDKGDLIIIIINTQGQIVQIHLIRINA